MRGKLPAASAILGDIVKRTTIGLQECFQLQEKSFVKKIEIRNKKIESLNAEIEQMKEDFYHFKRNSTMDAYFKKYTDVIMRTGRKEKDYLKELV